MTETPAQSNAFSADRLRSYIERVERLEEERKSLGGDIRDIFAEAKSAGFDVKVVKRIIRDRKQEAEDREAESFTHATYSRALGM